MSVTAAKRRGNDAYNEKCKRISLQPLKSICDDIDKAACDQSRQSYILQAVLERMERDGFTPTAAEWENYRR